MSSMVASTLRIPAIRKAWVCPSCRKFSKASPSFSNARSEPNQKPYYVTTPIFYVNAAPHIGHLYSMILADIIKRWQLLLGNKAILSTGTDEHGMKIQRAAANAGMDPQLFCDQGADIFKELAKRIKLSNDHFIRTSDPIHKKVVQHAWQVLDQRDYIYKAKHEGWYSVSDETFVPASSVEVIIDPPSGRKIMANKEDGKEVEWTSETNYHFRLSAFQDRLLQFYKDNETFVIPQLRMHEVTKMVQSGLSDLSISRPSERLTWGVPVPHDSSQTIYVWLDALFNYLTTAGFPWTPGQEQTGGWPANCQVVGKDIIRFHCIYWPAFLMALDIEPPKHILAHSHWTLGRRKMAKSTGVGVNPFMAIERFGTDCLRYYLANDGSLTQDSDYANEFVITRYKKDLQSSLGNLASRLLKSTRWDTRQAIQRHRTAGGTRNIHVSELNLRKALSELGAVTRGKMERLNIRSTTLSIMNCLHLTNQFLANAQPWKIYDSAQITRVRSRDSTIFLCAESLRICGILLQPFIPDAAEKLLTILAVKPERRGIDYAEFYSDDDYGPNMTQDEKGNPIDPDLARQRIPTIFPTLIA